MCPFIVIEVENNSVSDTTVVGDSQIVPIVVDWDTIDGDADAAQALINEILDCGVEGVPLVEGIVDRLQKIVDENEVECDDEPCPDCGETICFGECLDADEDEEADLDDLDEEDGAEDEDDDHGHFGDDPEDDEKKDEDYNGNEFNGGPATPLDPRD